MFAVAKKLHLPCLLFLLVLVSPQVKAKDAFAHGLVATQCHHFLIDSTKNQDSEEWMRAWNIAAAAFMSGYNVAAPPPKVLPHPMSYYWELKRRCENAPLETVAKALVEAWHELPVGKFD